LYLDGDIVVQKDPWPVLEEEFAKGGEDLLFQCDCGNFDSHEGCGNICSGVISQRHAASSSSQGGGEVFLLYSFDKDSWEAAEKQDQPYIQNRLRSLGIPYRTLRRDLWGNGHWQMSMKWKTTPWILIHYNYRIGDTKKQAMRKYGHWIIPY